MRLMPNCQDVQEHLTDLQEGVLPLHRRLAYRLHLLICRACRAAHNGLRALPVLAKSLLRVDDSLSPADTERIMARLLKSLREGDSSHPHG